MADTMTRYFEKLNKTESHDLDIKVCDLVKKEKQHTALIIAHIAEIGRRKYHLELGYKNLFEYCRVRLNLSDGSIWRRTQVAGVCRRFPHLLAALFEGGINLTDASLIAPHLTSDNADELISAAGRMTNRELKKYLAGIAPKEQFEPSIRSIPSKEPSSSAAETNESDAGKAQPADAASQAEALQAEQTGRTASSERKEPAPIFEPATEKRYNIRFSAGEGFTEKLNRLAEVLGIECAQKHMEQILEKALDVALDKKDPKRALERRRKREEKKKAKQAKTRPSEESGNTASPPDNTKEKKVQHNDQPADKQVTRHIPQEVRERVLERAGYQCEYFGPDGTRCSARAGLQVEHTLPFGVYKTNDERHLKAFCAAHNRFAAESFYGQAFMEQKIQARREAQQMKCAASNAG